MAATIGTIEIDHTFFHDFIYFRFADFPAPHLANCPFGKLQLWRVAVKGFFPFGLIPPPDEKNKENKQEQKKGNRNIAPFHKKGNLSGKCQ